MEEEIGIKVTRLRRRLSVEADDVKSPSTQSTPTKKRGGRLAAKPQLELIDENAIETEKPKRTRKSAARDAEPEEKPVTPARRSTRTRSNTSIVSETPVEAEDKGIPARRSTRIKSNTSIVAESVPLTDSPRAKRAARRTSQVGSDNEAPITPARQTRRTRKDSTSSIDKQVEPNAGKLGTQIKEVIAEEVENKINETTTKESNESTPSRRSPRLTEKTGRKSSTLDNDNKENKPHSDKKSKSHERSETVDGAGISLSTSIDKIVEVTEENNLSVSSSKLINDLDGEPKIGKANLNKTTSDTDLPQLKSKRHRTKSQTTITSSPSKDNMFLSDTEAIKKKNKRKSHDLSGAGDCVLDTGNKSVQEIEIQNSIKEVSLNSSTLSDKKKKKDHDKSMSLDTAIEEVSIINTSTKQDKSAIIEVNTTCNKIGQDDLNLSQKDDPNFTEKFFGRAPSGIVQSLIYIDDSDSNTGSVDKVNVNEELGNEDQCVPVIEHQLNEENGKESKNNLSYEPMDIDETMPENVSLSDFTENNASLRQEDINTGLEKRKSLLNISQVNNVSVVNSTNKSLRKSILLDQENDTDNLNKSKRQSLTITTSNDSINKSMNKSKRKSSSAPIDIDDNTDDNSNQPEFGESINKSLSKSKRKSSISNTVTDDDGMDNNTSNVIENDDTINKSLNKSKRKASIVNVDLDKSNDKGNKSKRKSSISNVVDDDDNIDNNHTNLDIGNDDTMSTNKSKRKSSISNIDVDKDGDKSVNAGIENECLTKSTTLNANIDDSINKSSISDNDINKSLSKSKRKSSITNADINDSVLKDLDKSKRKSVSMIVDIDEVDCSSNKSKRKSSIGKIEAEDIINKSSNKSKRKSSGPNELTENNLENSITKTKRESVDTNIDNDTTIDKRSDKSQRKSSISNSDTDHYVDKSSNKSKRKSSISHIESQSFDKSSNANKSTLVLSQIKDMSETNVPKYIYEFNESNDSNEQISKSVNVPNVIKDKESDKNNLSQTYSTSTPLQQKSMKKLGMQINTSIIAPNSVTKTEKVNALNRSKKNISVLSQNNEESEPSDENDEEDSEEDDDEDAEEEEESEEESELSSESKMIDDEAEEASNDYESGDSRDDDEKEYEAENEIVEKGETLDSVEEDFSDDSDYERDSFIVDSEEQDNSLLSGSGDDLSMSDNELNMSAKSKKKFNERKMKEQKKASREMYEARHKLNESDKSKPKKSKRLQLESSDSESEGDVQSKKNRRARIDSSQDISQNQSEADKSISKKKKKVKRLSESGSEDVASNEKEISIQENNDVEKVDPLSLQNIVKKEPKTPQKDLNISTVAITNIEEVEEIQLDENVSIVKMNQTSDPLQVAQDDAMEDDSDDSISENEEITQNYESVLNDLNNKSKKVKSLDISLNLNKKTKQKAKEPIVDQLNLTQVKKSKKKTAISMEKTEPKRLDKSLTNKTIEKISKAIQVEDSSDSIDMKLLFNEDSTDGENKVTAVKANDTKEVIEDFIPLKRTEGKTNILESTDVTSSAQDDSILNVSKSKKNKRKSEESATMNDQENENVSFFIDTTGSHTDIYNTSVKDSAKKKKQKKNVSSANIEEVKDDDDSNDAPLEMSYRSEKNYKSKQDLNSTQTDETKVNTTTSGTPGQSGKKKKNKKGLNNSEINVEDADDAAEKSINSSILSITGSNKKKKKLSESHIEQNIDETQSGETAHNVSVGSTKKQKKKKASESFSAETENVIADNMSKTNEDHSSKKRKRKLSNNPSIEESTVKDDTKALNTFKSLNESILATNQKKKRKIAHTDEEDAPQTEGPDAVSEIQQAKQEENPAAKKTKKKNKSAEEQNPTKNNDETTNKTKKRKVRADDDGDAEKMSKVTKQNSFDKVYVPRLPSNLLKQLDDKPKKDIETRTKVTSTSSFKVEETKKRRNKPSNYLEQSVYLNDSTEERTTKSLLKKPKVLPFIPTASTSSYGFTTNFRVKVIPQETQFVAQSSEVSNFKKDYLQKNRIKKLGTFEMYKRQRNIKISKF